MSSVYQPKRKELAKVKFAPLDKKYRIHDDDKVSVNKYKK